jgi:tRNA(fMet)-specific endonuclease VapC
MLFLLDTNALSDLMQGQTVITGRLLNLIPPDEAITSPVVVGEILYGLARLPIGAKRRHLESKATSVLPLAPSRPMPEDTGQRYATIKLDSQRRGLTLKDNDLWVAATALALNATLVTRDTDFAGIPGLTLQDWTV